MKCPFNENILSQFVDDALPEQISDSVKEHVGKCDVCREKSRTFTRVNEVFGSLSPIKESDNFDFLFNQKLATAIAEAEEPAFYEKIYEKIYTTVNSMPVLRAPVLARAAVTVTLMVAALFTGLYYTEPENPTVTQIKGTAFISRGEEGTWKKIKKNTVIRKGDLIRSDRFSSINIVLPSKYYLRLKERTTIKIARISPKHRAGTLQVDLKKGDILVDIDKGFKGSKFKVNTQLATVHALGTKFAVSVSENTRKNWVGVLEGKVKVSSKQKGLKYAKLPKEVFVGSGMKIEIIAGRPAREALPLVEKEWKMLSELYMFGRKTKVALLISTGSQRVLELLAPCPIFIIDEKPRTTPKQLEEAAFLIDKALKTNDRSLHLEGISKLKKIVELNPEAEYNVQLLLFIGAYYYHLELYQQAIGTFEGLLDSYPNRPLSSLAECSIAVIYEEALGDMSQAKSIYGLIEEKYPNTPEAAFARQKIAQKPAQ